MAKVRPGRQERALYRMRMIQRAQAEARHDPSWKARSCLDVVQSTDHNPGMPNVREDGLYSFQQRGDVRYKVRTDKRYGVATEVAILRKGVKKRWQAS